MKVTKGEKTSDGGGSEGKVDELKASSRRKSKQESEMDAKVLTNKRRRDFSSSSEELIDVEEKYEKERAANGKYRDGKREDRSYREEHAFVKRDFPGRKGYVKSYVKDAVSKKNADYSLGGRRERESDAYHAGRNNRHIRHEVERNNFRNDPYGPGRHEEGRRSYIFGERLEQKNKRTVYIGNIPGSIRSMKHLLRVLDLDESVVEEGRILPAKGYRHVSEINKGDRVASQKAYVTLKDEKYVKPLLGKNGLSCEGSELKIDMVIHSKHYDREKTVIVKSLHFGVTEGQLCDLFSPFGLVKGYRLVRDRYTNRSLGYGFIFFENRESVEEAIKAMNGKLVNERPIIVSSMEHYSGRRTQGGGHLGGDRRYYDYRVRKDINKRDVPYRRH